MGASFRNVGQIHGLCGCDLLTISPALLEKLSGSADTVPRRLSLEAARTMGEDRAPQRMSEAQFRWLHNEDEMASDKLNEGIRKFAADARLLEKAIAERLGL